MNKTSDELKDELRRRIAEAGSLRKWSAEAGLPPSFVSGALTGRYNITDRIAAALGYRRDERVWQKD